MQGAELTEEKKNNNQAVDLTVGEPRESHSKIYYAFFIRKCISAFLFLDRRHSHRTERTASAGCFVGVHAGGESAYNCADGFFGGRDGGIGAVFREKRYKKSSVVLYYDTLRTDDHNSYIDDRGHVAFHAVTEAFKCQ